MIEIRLSDSRDPWWDDISTPEIEDRDAILRQSFLDAISELKETLGGNPGSWRWGELHSRTFTNELGVGPLGLLLNRGPFETAGGSSLVNNTGWSVKEDFQVRGLPSFRMIIDLANPDQSMSIHTAGQSGHAYHRNYIDMAETWGNGEYLPMLWSQDEVEDAAVEHLTLIPK
jgi:penicillin amidase